MFATETVAANHAIRKVHLLLITYALNKEGPAGKEYT